MGMMDNRRSGSCVEVTSLASRRWMGYHCPAKVEMGVVMVVMVVEAAVDEGRAAEGLLLGVLNQDNLGNVYTPRFRPILWLRDEAST